LTPNRASGTLGQLRRYGTLLSLAHADLGHLVVLVVVRLEG